MNSRLVVRAVAWGFLIGGLIIAATGTAELFGIADVAAGAVALSLTERP